MISRVHDQKRHSWRAVFWSLLIFFLFLAIFGSSVYFFRKAQRNDLAKKAEDKDVQIFDRTPLPIVEDAEANLLNLKTGIVAGTAVRRLVSDDEFIHTIKSQLPIIDPAVSFYEGWLVRTVPYGFFSTGEMVVSDEGQFVLEWKGNSPADYSGYDKVVITIEARDGNPDPSEHILEGVFGQ